MYFTKRKQRKNACFSGKLLDSYVWGKVTFYDWIHSRDYIDFFLQYVEDYANEIGDSRRPFVKKTWREVFEKWEKMYR